MDNFRILNFTRPVKNGRQILNYWCRLWKELAQKSQGSGQSAKKIRTVEVFGTKLNMYKIWKDNQWISVTLLRNKTSWEKDVCYKHNHLWEYLNIIKVNLR